TQASMQSSSASIQSKSSVYGNNGSSLKLVECEVQSDCSGLDSGSSLKLVECEV
uniref:Uncharacterized protein n=1 Tax=Amphimedon queenslandica TaxID=400682 RepID=A0A1X7TUN8_AMPQE